MLDVLLSRVQENGQNLYFLLIDLPNNVADQKRTKNDPDHSNAEKDDIEVDLSAGCRQAMAIELVYLLIHLSTNSKLAVGQDEELGLGVDIQGRVILVFIIPDFDSDFIDVVYHGEDELIGLESRLVPILTDNNFQTVSVVVF